MTELRTSESIRAAIAAFAERQQVELDSAAELKARQAKQAGNLHELSAKDQKIWAELPLKILVHEQAGASIEHQIAELRAELVVASAHELVKEARVKSTNCPDVEARGREIAARALAEMRALKREADAYAEGLQGIADKARAFERVNGSSALVNAGLLVTEAYNGTHLHMDNTAHRVSWILEAPDLLAQFAHEIDLMETMERNDAEYEARAAEASAERAGQAAAELAAQERYATAVFRDLTPEEQASKEQLAEQEERGIRVLAALTLPAA